MIGLSLAFSVLTVVSAAFAVIFTDTRKIVLSAWVASMSVGALFLSCGAEYLAIVQWIVGTLVAISFLVFATMFGEYGPVDPRSVRERIFDGIPAVLVGGAFFFLIAVGVRGLSLPEQAVTGPIPPNDLAAVGQALGERHLVSLELAAFMLLAVLIGAGVISRGENRDAEEEESP